MKEATVYAGSVDIYPQTAPSTIEAAVAALEDDGAVHLELASQLPEVLLPDETVAATAAALERRPGIRLTVEGRVWHRPGLSLEWLEQFSHVRDLRVHVYDALDLSPIRHLHDLRKLSVEETKRRSLSLAFLRETPLIEELYIDGTGGRDFDAIASLERLRLFTLRAARVKTLEALRDHPTLEGVTVTLGGIRDLTPLATIPNLRALYLWGIRLLDTDDFAAIGDCKKLGGLSIGALPRVRNLSALARGPAETLRFLMLDGMKGLETLCHLADCKRLEEVTLDGSRPADRRIDLLAGAPSLTHLRVGDPYSKSEIEAARRAFHGQYFASGLGIVGSDTATPPRVRWRMRSAEYLDLLRSENP